MICKNCGHQVPEDGKFCENCGSIVENNTAETSADTSVEASVEASVETPVETPVEAVQQEAPAYEQPTPAYEQPAYDQPTVASAPAGASQKQPMNPAKLIAGVGAVVVVLLVVLLLKSCMGGGYEKPLDNMMKTINKQQTDIDKIATAVLPAPIADTYTEMMGVLESSDAYGDDIKDIKKDLPDALTDLYETLFDALEDEYGKNVKFSYEVTDKEKLDKDERKAIQEAYAGLADVAPGLIACVEGLEECTDLEEKEIKKLVKAVESLQKELEKFKVSAGYKVELDLIVEGKEDDDDTSVELVIIKANGEWMIDILSTAAIAEDEDIEDLPELVEDMELGDVSDEMEEVAEMMEDMEEDIIEVAIEAIEEGIDALGDVEDYLGSMLGGSMGDMSAIEDLY